MSEATRLFVGGEWRESLSGRTYEKRNPWRPDETTGVHAAASAADAAAAVEAARGESSGRRPPGARAC